MVGTRPKLMAYFRDHISVLTAAQAGVPTPEHLAELETLVSAAAARGYYTPTEDDRLRETYARYLGIRAALWDVIQGLRPQARAVRRQGHDASPDDLRGFGIAFCAAELIVRTGEVLIDLARGRPIVWRKLDEADARYGLPRKSFTRLYRQLTSAFRMESFYRACATYDAHKVNILAALDTPETAQVADILQTLNLPTASRGDHLRRYGGFVRHSLLRRTRSAVRNVVFSVFEMIGSDVADLKIPLVKPPRATKRVTRELIVELRSYLQPGDVFVTRHDDAMSNLFLPGFWPHSALWLGAEDADILEAKKDGVLLRAIEETLQVDAFTVIRPQLRADQIAAALTRGRAHTGKLYDFIFDFRTTDRLVCTEVIYRTYHGAGEIDFALSQQAGRHCLSAEDLLNQGIGQGWFDVVATVNVGGSGLLTGAAAKTALRQSFAATF